MATAPGTNPVPPPSGNDTQEIKIISHSTMFYWWPVWAVGLLMAILTWFDGYLVALVPPGTKPYKNAMVTVKESETKEATIRDRDVLVVEDKLHLPVDAETGVLLQPKLHLARQKSFGVLFVFTLMLVIVITNIPLRGLWSIIVIIVLALFAVIFALMGVWDWILEYISLLDIRINLAGYMTIATALFIIWIITVVFFDQQIYMVFTPGQLRVRLEIGGGETSYDTMGMVIQKQRDDLFRHWVLGLGSGDLVVRTSGAHSHEFHLPNVLFVGRKLKQIEEMQRDRPVVKG